MIDGQQIPTAFGALCDKLAPCFRGLTGSEWGCGLKMALPVFIGRDMGPVIGLMDCRMASTSRLGTSNDLRWLWTALLPAPEAGVSPPVKMGTEDVSSTCSCR